MDFFHGLLPKRRSRAENLRVRVSKLGEERVNVSLPAGSARWMIDLIPADVLVRIHEEGIPIDDIQQELIASEELQPRGIFKICEAERTVEVWLE
jgi:hypothetical protein